MPEKGSIPYHAVQHSSSRGHEHALTVPGPQTALSFQLTYFIDCKQEIDGIGVGGNEPRTQCSSHPQTLNPKPQTFQP